MAYVSVELRAQVAAKAKFHCEYCHSSERITSGPMHVEHIWPATKGGATTLENLAYACARCNLHKGMRTHYRDPVSQRLVSLFNPRLQKWSRHFTWSTDGARIVGRTRTGRATVFALNMNDTTIVMSRSFWISLGIHPPTIR